MVEKSFNDNAITPHKALSPTQSEAQILFAEAKKYAYPVRTTGAFELLHITDPDAAEAKATMEKMYKLYEKVFPLAEERESMEKLMALLGKNKTDNDNFESAPCREQWVMIQNEKGDIVAANSSMIFSAANNPEVSRVIAGTTHMSYTFVDPAFRGQGHGERVNSYCSEMAREFIAATYKDGRTAESIAMIEFAEQNAILKMTPENILIDTAGAKIDQSKRREIFETWGFRQLDLPSPYVQLPLIPRDQGGTSAANMELVCRGIPAPHSFINISSMPSEVPAEVVKFHLYEFQNQAVAGGAYDIETDIDWIRQATALNAVKTVKVLPELDHAGLKDKVWQTLEQIVNASDFDSAVFTEKTIAEITGIAAVSAKAANENGKNVTPKVIPKSGIK
jgi:GNAT superfamily N-acetyltransferase